MAAHDFCTYFDSGYLARALVLHDSLVESGIDFRLTALCLDEDARRAVEAIGAPTLRAIGLDELEQHDPELLASKATRSTHEYYFTIGPCLLRYLFERDAPDHLTYLDADMRFYSSPAPLFEESAGAAVVLVGHRFPDRMRHLERAGYFNVAWVGFAGDDEGRACLDWWRERCIEWCFDRIEDDRFADQKYLDEFPKRFERVHELRHPGADVAPWNLADPPLAWDGTRFTVGGEPLVFFHFQGMKQLGRHLISLNLAMYGNRATPAVRRLYRGYVRDLQAATSSNDLVEAPRRPLGRRSLRSWVAMLRREVITLGPAPRRG
jgi:hypothetical protein